MTNLVEALAYFSIVSFVTLVLLCVVFAITFSIMLWRENAND